WWCTRRKTIDFKELSKEPWIVGLPDTPGVTWLADLFRAQGAEFPKHYIATFSLHLRNDLAATARSSPPWRKHSIAQRSDSSSRCCRFDYQPLRGLLLPSRCAIGV